MNLRECHAIAAAEADATYLSNTSSQVHPAVMSHTIKIKKEILCVGVSRSDVSVQHVQPHAPCSHVTKHPKNNRKTKELKWKKKFCVCVCVCTLWYDSCATQQKKKELEIWHPHAQSRTHHPPKHTLHAGTYRKKEGKLRCCCGGSGVDLWGEIQVGVGLNLLVHAALSY
jgi:hypothetical protein